MYQRADVGVVIPAWNADAYLEEAVLSVRRQTYEDWKLVIVDDGSTDDTASLADRLAESDARISVRHQDNHGVSAARNAGLAEMPESVRFVLFLDADDLLLPSCLTSLRDVVLANPRAAGAYGMPGIANVEGEISLGRLEDSWGWERRAVESWRMKRIDHDAPTGFATTVLWPPIQTAGQALLSRARLEDAGAWRTMPGEDWDMWLRLAAKGDFVRLREFVMAKRSAPGSLSSNGKWLAGAEPILRRFLVHSPYTSEQRRVARIGHFYSCWIRMEWAFADARRGDFLSAAAQVKRATAAFARFGRAQVGVGSP